jgi:hypothetical protein
VRVNERSLVVWIGGGLALAAAVAVLLFVLFEGDDDGGSGGPTGAAATVSSLTGGPDEVLYLSGTSLVRRDVEAREEEVVRAVPSPDVYAAPGSTWIAYITFKAGEGDGFTSEPVLHLYDLETNEKERYGPAVAPRWNPGGTHVAFLEPVDPRNCQAESCGGDSRIGVVEAATGEERSLLDPGNYSILGWSGDRILVSDFEAPASVIVVSLDDERSLLEMPASQYWGSSPDGRWVVKTNAKKTEFISIEDGKLGDRRVAVELGDYTLLEGSWSHDSSRVAAVTSITAGVERGQGDEKRVVNEQETTQVMVFSPEDPDPVLVDGTFGASGDVLWSVDDEALVFSVLLDPKKALFQTRQCEVGGSSQCAVIASWTEGVTLLRTE